MAAIVGSSDGTFTIPLIRRIDVINVGVSGEDSNGSTWQHKLQLRQRTQRHCSGTGLEVDIDLVLVTTDPLDAGDGDVSPWMARNIGEEASIRTDRLDVGRFTLYTAGITCQGKCSGEEQMEWIHSCNQTDL